MNKIVQKLIYPLLVILNKDVKRLKKKKIHKLIKVVTNWSIHFFYVFPSPLPRPRETPLPP